MSKLKSFQAQFEETVEKGITAVEEQYVALAAKPFDYALKLEKEAKTYSVKTLREKHDQTVDSIYESVRSFNKKLNELVADVIAKIEGGDSEEKSADKVAKKTRTAGKKVSKAADTAAEKVEEAAS